LERTGNKIIWEFRRGGGGGNTNDEEKDEFKKSTLREPDEDECQVIHGRKKKDWP